MEKNLRDRVSQGAGMMIAGRSSWGTAYSPNVQVRRAPGRRPARICRTDEFDQTVKTSCRQRNNSGGALAVTRTAGVLARGSLQRRPARPARTAHFAFSYRHASKRHRAAVMRLAIEAPDHRPGSASLLLLASTAGQSRTAPGAGHVRPLLQHWAASMTSGNLTRCSTTLPSC
jgi:hypothetical protein